MYSHMGLGFGFPGLGLLLVILFGALIVIGVALLVRRPATPAPPAPAVDTRSQAQRVLEERFARGEIDEAEFRARLEVLLGATWMPGGAVAPPAAPAPTAPAPAAFAAPGTVPSPEGTSDSGGQDQ